MSLNVTRRMLARHMLQIQKSRSHVVATTMISRRLLSSGKPKSPGGRKKLVQKKKKKAASSNTTSTTNKKRPTQAEMSLTDPQLMAQEYVQFSASRKQGTESILELTQTQKLSNYGLAVSLMGFVTWVWYYSMTSVGKSGGGIEQLMEEADEARENAATTSLAEQEVGDMVRTEMGLGSVDKDEYGESLQRAVAAPEDIARAEETRNLQAGANETKTRPLWKKVILFWKKD